MHCPIRKSGQCFIFVVMNRTHIYHYKGHSFCQAIFIPQPDRSASEDYNFRKHCTFQMMLNTEIIKWYVSRAQAGLRGSSRVKGSSGKIQTGCGNSRSYSEKVRVLEEVQKVEQWQPTWVNKSGKMHNARWRLPNNTPPHCKCWWECKIRSNSWGKDLLWGHRLGSAFRKVWLMRCLEKERFIQILGKNVQKRSAMTTLSQTYLYLYIGIYKIS